MILFAISISSCNSGYKKLQMNADPDVKYEAAKIYFLEQDYAKASELLDEIVSYYRGSAKAEQILYLLSESYMRLNDYYSASEYFKSYIRNYPRGEYAEDVRFKIAYCYYLESPDARLDQSSTYAAISSFSEFIETYPNATNIDDARKYLFEMYDKIAYKDYLNAKLYYDLGLYGGNNYQAAVIVAEEALKDFPDTSHKEELLFVVLKSKYKEATHSVADKSRERYSEVIDEYYRYASEYSDGKYIKDANRILKAAQKVVSK